MWLSRAQPEDTIFVWGNAAAIYNQAEVKPATPYITDFLVHSFGGYDQVLAEVRAKPPRWLAVCNQSEENFRPLYAIIRTGYTRVLELTYCDLYLKFPW
jgi:hypothetical protein